MSPLEEAPHLLSALRQIGNDGAGRLRLVRLIQAEALGRMAAHTPPGFDASDDDHCVTLALSVERSDASSEVKAAARLLHLCVRAAEAPDTFDGAMLVSAYSQLDLHAVERDGARQAGSAKGGKSKPAKMPKPDALRAELAQLRAGRNLSETEAKGILRTRHGVTAQALNRKLKKT